MLFGNTKCVKKKTKGGACVRRLPAPSALWGRVGGRQGARLQPQTTWSLSSAHRSVQRAEHRLQRREHRLRPARPEWGTGGRGRAGGSQGGRVERGHLGTPGCPDRSQQVLRNTAAPPFCLDCLLYPTAHPFRPWLPQLPTTREPHATHDPRQLRALHAHQPGREVPLPA